MQINIFTEFALERILIHGREFRVFVNVL